MCTPEEMTAHFASTGRRRHDGAVVEDEDPDFADGRAAAVRERQFGPVNEVPTAPALGTS